MHQGQTIVCLTSLHPHTPTFPTHLSFSPAYAIGGITTLMVAPKFSQYSSYPINFWVCTFPNYTVMNTREQLAWHLTWSPLGRETGREGGRDGWLQTTPSICFKLETYYKSYCRPNGLCLAINHYLGSSMQPLRWLQRSPVKRKAFHKSFTHSQRGTI